ncbi:hypothetical protein Slin15195_G037650 [Septoria linicola]|uniref:Uncharacterized protein n=1 Tax=Septoria linicola TaxID=215465 RepID=A0A9Q9EG45_9PEZI|nr:hypothetical protein Slin14017_G119060 [Septoria linicola]USW50446.1 hypothetical protein Slin15195_G037650 [Septoria linicola]
MPDRGRDPRDSFVRDRPPVHSRRSYDSAYSSRDQLSRVPSESSMSSRSPSPRRSRNRSRRRRRRYSSYSRSPSPRYRRDSGVQEDVLMPLPEDKPWFKKKTLWATLASAATIIAVVPTWKSANASKSSAKGSNRSADASHRSADAAERAADASLRSARAVERSTKAVERSANAVVNTAVASGHQDHHGRYCGPAGGGQAQAQEKERRRGSSERGSRGSGGLPRRKQIEYHDDPLKQILQSANVPVGLPVKA